MVQCVANAAEAGIPSAFISLELERQDVMRLAIAQHSKIPRAFLDRFDIRGVHVERFKEAKRKMADWPLWILDGDCWNGPLDRKRLAALVSDGVKCHGWQFVVIDYMGMIANCRQDAGQYDADIQNSTALKAIARDASVALVIVTPLRKSANFASKPGKNKGKAKPALDDLLGAGRLGYDAVTALYVECVKHDVEAGRERTGEIHVDIWKARYADTSPNDQSLKLKWHPSCGRIVTNIIGLKPDEEPEEELEDAPF